MYKSVKQVPFASVLMWRRQKIDYDAVFQELKKALGTFSLDDCVQGFEISAWVILRENFTGISIHGCLFHYSQAIYKRVGFLGLTGLDKQDTHVRKVVRKLFALPLLPHRRMVEVFASMLVAAEDADYDPQLSELLSYVDKTWFHSPIWSSKEICSYQSLVPTNNDCEGYHRRLKERCGTYAYKLVTIGNND